MNKGADIWSDRKAARVINTRTYDVRVTLNKEVII